MGGGKVWYKCSASDRCGAHSCHHRNPHVRDSECSGECSRDMEATCVAVPVSSVDAWTEERKAKAEAYERAMAQALEDVANLRQQVRELEEEAQDLEAEITRLRERECRYASECSRRKPVKKPKPKGILCWFVGCNDFACNGDAACVRCPNNRENQG